MDSPVSDGAKAPAAAGTNGSRDSARGFGRAAQDRRRLTRRIVGGAVIVALAIVALTGTMLWRLHQAQLNDGLSDLSALDLLVAAQTERSFENVSVLLDDIAADIEAESIASAPALRQAAGDQTTFRLLRAKMAGVRQLDALAITTADGDVVNRTRSYPVAPAINLGTRDYFLRLRDHPELKHYISPPLQSGADGSWTIYIAKRLNAPNGAFLGILVGAVGLRYFDGFFDNYLEAIAGGSKSISLWRNDGVLLAQAPAVPAAADGLAPVAATTPDLHRPAPRNGLTAFWTTDAQGSVAVAQRHLDGFPLTVAVRQSASAVLTPWNEETLATALGGSVLLVLVGIAVCLLLRQLGADALVSEERARANRETEAREDIQRAMTKAEAAMRDAQHSEARFRDIIEVGSDWIWETDTQHRFTMIAGARRPKTNLIGKTRWEQPGVEPADSEFWRRHRADLDAHLPFRHFRFSVSLPNGRFDVCVSGKPIFDDDGTFVGYRGTVADETELVAARDHAARADARLRNAIDSIAEGFVIYDAEDRFVMCNEAYRKMYPENAAGFLPGVKYEEIMRQAVASGRHPDAIGREEEWLAARLRRHQEAAEPEETRLADGRWILRSERRMADGGIAGLRIDITALKNVHESLRASQQRLNRTQQIAHIGTVERNLRTNEVIWSDETYRIFGVSPENHIPTTENLLARVHPDDHQLLVNAFRRSHAQRSNTGIKFRAIRPNGEQRVIFSQADATFDEAGQPLYVSVAMMDITEKETASYRQIELETQLRHSEKLTALGTLAGGIAHDLNNTLVPIQALSKLAMRELPPETPTRADLETIYQASLQARDLVRQILAFSRKQELVTQPTDIGATVRETLHMLRASVPSTIELIERLEAVPPILADATQLQQVVVNLVTNGAHAIGDGVGRITVSLEAFESPDNGPMIRLSIADTGCGISPEIQRRMFEPFFTTKAVGEGTGLGLSVVHGIVTSHGGTIEVRSAPGEGAEFAILLPAKAADRYLDIAAVA